MRPLAQFYLLYKTTYMPESYQLTMALAWLPPRIAPMRDWLDELMGLHHVARCYSHT